MPTLLDLATRTLQEWREVMENIFWQSQSMNGELRNIVAIATKKKLLAQLKNCLEWNRIPLSESSRKNWFVVFFSLAFFFSLSSNPNSKQNTNSFRMRISFGNRVRWSGESNNALVANWQCKWNEQRDWQSRTQKKNPQQISQQKTITVVETSPRHRTTSKFLSRSSRMENVHGIWTRVWGTRHLRKSHQTSKKTKLRFNLSRIRQNKNKIQLRPRFQAATQGTVD